MYGFYVYRIVFLTIFCALFMGCVGNSANNLNAKNNVKYLYGVGSGSSEKIAKHEAIKDLVTNLQVSVRYSLDNSILQDNNNLYTVGSSNVSLISNIDDLPGIEVDKTSIKDGIYNLRVRVNKSIMHKQLLERQLGIRQTLDSMLGECQTVSFNDYENFKYNVNKFQSNNSILQILDSEQNSYQQISSRYASLASNPPKYNLVINFKNNISYRSEISNILLSELGKFITIDKNAPKKVVAEFADSNEIRIYLKFFDCNGELEDSIQINTFMKEANLKNNSNKTRFGAIIHKGIKYYDE